MVRPNSACVLFCNWMLNVSRQRLTTVQRALIQDIYNAGVGVYPVTDQEWYNFNLFAGWRNPYYLVYRDYAGIDYTGLATSLLSYYNFEGTSNVSFGTINGANTSISFGLPYGKITKGANFSTSSSKITFIGRPALTTWSINCWLRINTNSGGINGLFYGSTYGQTVNMAAGTSKLTVNFGGGVFTGPVIPYNVFQMYTIVCNSGSISVYINGTLIGSGISSPNPFSFYNLGHNSAGASAIMYADCLGYWSRALTQSDINQLYNSGAALQYPF